MTEGSKTPLDALETAWADAALAAALFAIDPAMIGGVLLRSASGPVRDRWLGDFRALLPAATPVRTAPLHISNDRLLGGLDLVATLATGRCVLDTGVLPCAHDGVLIINVVERWTANQIALVTHTMDRCSLLMERDGFRATFPARFGVIAFDESLEDEAPPPASLSDRLAFHLDLDAISHRRIETDPWTPPDIAEARARLKSVGHPDDEIIAALCGTALKLGITSLRASIAALHVARLHAALAGRTEVTNEDAIAAARLVLAPRALIMPADSATGTDASVPAPDQDTQQPAPDDNSNTAAPESGIEAQALDDMMVAAALAAIPPNLLTKMKQTSSRAPNNGSTDGRSGAKRNSATRGRIIGTRAASERTPPRLDLLATLRAAAPWQRLRATETTAFKRSTSIYVRRSDLRVSRFKHQAGSTVVFAVDASGSSALNRLAEAKGAAELLLAECYARRDRVALIAFRGTSAETLLEPSRSLARARRCLAALPGGGGTPLATGIDAALQLAHNIRRKGDTPLVVVMTDGRANVTRNGSGGRAVAQEHALDAARHLKSTGVGTMLIDTSPQPHPFSRMLADAMGAQYMPLPYADPSLITSRIKETRQRVMR